MTTPAPPADEWIGVGELCRRLSRQRDAEGRPRPISEATARRYRQAGVLPHRFLNSRVVLYNWTLIAEHLRVEYDAAPESAPDVIRMENLRKMMTAGKLCLKLKEAGVSPREMAREKQRVEEMESELKALRGVLADRRR